MKIGVLTSVNNNVEENIRNVRELGLDNCQLKSWNAAVFTDEYVQRTKNALEEYGVSATGFWCGWSKPTVWNFYEGQTTLGLVPTEYRWMRVKTLCKGSDYAKAMGVSDVITHMGFIPENPNDPNFMPFCDAVRHVAVYCKKNGQNLLFETGQETPVTLMRAISDIGLYNLGINLDPANLIAYGKGNPIDALDIFGDKIKGVHVKDADYPTGSFRELGHQQVVGEGTVNYPVFLPKLLKNGYTGDLYIEREISGDQQIIDIKKTIDYVKENLK